MVHARDTFCMNRDPISLANATVVKKGDAEEGGFARATAAVLDAEEGGFARATAAVLEGDGGGCPAPEFNESESRMGITCCDKSTAECVYVRLICNEQPRANKIRFSWRTCLA